MSAKIVEIDPNAKLDAQIAGLGLRKLPPLIVLGDAPGDADASLTGKILAVCSRVLAPIALDPGALIIDNARHDSCSALMGAAAVQEDETPQLVGIVPAGRAAEEIDPNHPLVLRLPPGWIDTAKYKFQVIDAFAAQSADAGQPIAVLFGGGDYEKQAVIRCTRRDWPIVVVKGTGGLADQIAQAITPGPDGNPVPIADPDLRRIVEDGSIFPASLEGNVDDLTHLILGRIAPRSESARAVLTDAWTLFNRLDEAALGRQALFRGIEFCLVWLAVAAALVAILQSTNVAGQYISAGALHWFVLVIPIVISIVGASNSYFRDGIKWILLRGAAESLKREIFRFRAQAGIYSDDKCSDVSREAKLAAKIADISNQLEHSEVNKTSLPGGTPPKPADLTFLSPDEYVTHRMDDQIRYFSGKTTRLSLSLHLGQIGIFVAGGIGTLLAAIHLDIWVALATATVTAIATKLQTDQVENSLVQYNQALAALRSIQLWWKALSRWEKGRQKNIDLLVEQTERTLESEMAGWVQQMQSALEKLTEKEPAQESLSAKAGS